MSERTDALRDIFLEVSDETVLTEKQVETPSPLPAGEGEVPGPDLPSPSMDGLADAIEGAETDRDGGAV